MTLWGKLTCLLMGLFMPCMVLYMITGNNLWSGMLLGAIVFYMGAAWIGKMEQKKKTSEADVTEFEKSE